MQNFVQVGLGCAVFLLKIAQAMEITPGDLILVRQEPRLVLLSVLAASTITPIVTLLVVLTFHPPHAIEIGLALAAVSPAPPLFISSAIGAGGRVEYVASLQRMLSLLALATTPLLLKLLATFIGFSALISPVAVGRQIATALFLPTCLGMLSRAWFSTVTLKLAPTLRQIGGCAYLVAIMVVFARSYPTLLDFGCRSYASVFLIIVGSLMLGQRLGPSCLRDRTTLALACGGRNTGLAMLIASLNFPGAIALHELVPYSLVSWLSTTVYLRWAKTRSTRAERGLTEC